MRANEILKEDDEPSTKWESWPGKASEIHSSYVTSALTDHEHPAHEIFKAVKANPKARMYRGMRFPQGDPESIYYLNPTTAPERTSKDTHNFYTWFIDHISPEWQSYPKRGKSFICATSPGITGMYGAPFVMVPVARTTVGVCPSDDIWYSFKNTDLNGMITTIARAMQDYKVPYPGNAQEFVTASNKLAELIADDPERNTKLNLDSYHMSKFGQARFNPITYMKHLLNPKDNGFSIVDWPGNLPAYVEVWFSAPCCAIPYKLFNRLMGFK